MAKKDLKPIERNTERFNKVKAAMQFAKSSPEITTKFLENSFPEGIKTQTAAPIPVNVTLGEYEDQILHHKVIEYFLNKAGTIVMMDCHCRESNKCKNHSIELGCFYLGKGAAELDLTRYPGARRITKEEALVFERKAYENGLIPHLGKLRADAKAFRILEYEHEFMSICHCCSCCCEVAIMKYGPPEWKQIVNRTEGVELRVDPDKCTGCASCFKVCIYGALRMENDITSIKQDTCMGCGRCERECPSKAISITIDYSRMDELFERFDSRVDISG